MAGDEGVRGGVATAGDGLVRDGAAVTGVVTGRGRGQVGKGVPEPAMAVGRPRVVRRARLVVRTRAI
jgi:hypothetical protein